MLPKEKLLTDDYPHATLEARAIIATTVVISSAAIMAIAMAVMSVCPVAMPVITTPVMPISVVIAVGTGMPIIIASVIGCIPVLNRSHMPSVYFAADYVSHHPPDGSTDQGGFSVSADCLAN